MSSAIDPALAGYSPRVAQHHALPPATSSMHHRPSLSYPPPHQPLNPHMRNQSSPGPPAMAFSQPYVQQSVSQPPMPPHGPIYEHRHSYYQEPQAPVYGSYERSQEGYYARASYGGYDSSYGDIRFQQHVGLDHNAFNRKRRGNLPKEATNLLKEWFQQNRQSPYPTEDQKMELCNRTGLSLNQVRGFFVLLLLFFSRSSSLTDLPHLPLLFPQCHVCPPVSILSENTLASGRLIHWITHATLPIRTRPYANIIMQVSNWFINARRRAPQKEQREREANGPEA